MANPDEKIVQFPDTVSGQNIGALFGRIAKVAAAVGAVKKDKNHPQGYAYFSADNVMGHLVKAMADNGIAVIPRILNREIVTEGDGHQRWLIDYQFIIGDCDGNTISVDWIGEAPLKVQGKNNSLYSDDKSLGKAHTYAHKHFLLKLFLVSTVETDDLDENVPDHAAGKQSASPAKNGLDDIDGALGQDKNAGDNWLISLYGACQSFYPHENHMKNSIELALNEGRINRTMSISAAAAIMFKHCAMKSVEDKGLELSEGEIEEALEGKLSAYLKIEGNTWGSAWDTLKRYDLWKTQQAATQESQAQGESEEIDEMPL